MNPRHWSGKKRMNGWDYVILAYVAIIIGSLAVAYV